MTVITKKGQVTLPKLLREKIDMKEGDEVVFELEEDAMKIKKVEKRSLLTLGGIAKDRVIGRGDEREHTKRLSQEGLQKRDSEVSEHIFVDTNVFLRFFIADVEELYKKAKHLFEKAENGEIKLVTSEIGEKYWQEQ